MKIKQAVILVGGRGTRLKPYTNKLPKPLVKVNNVSFCDYLLKSLIDNGITKILFLTGYKHSLFKKKYKDNKSLKFNFSYASTNCKTGYRLINAENYLEGNFLLLYGDNYLKFDLSKMINFKKKYKAKITCTVFKNDNGTGEYGDENNIFFNKNNLIQKYDKSRKSPKLNGVNIGYYLISKNSINFDVKKNIALEDLIFDNLKSKKNIYSFPVKDQYYYITSRKSLKNFEKIVKKKKINFLNSFNEK